MDTQPERGTISSPFGHITIERTRVKFDDAAWTAIPEGVPVKVNISKGTLWLAAHRSTPPRCGSPLTRRLPRRAKAAPWGRRACSRGSPRHERGGAAPVGSAIG